ncbi:response regulator [Paraglaciecola aquimarina]|uniref:histidine kinase n=1 Tax=Paraglaciecola algarum TaxID=3050085 RepID=A0ABS9D4N6_9ALTE|nr:response regulator [Paraglaciecola sp. G1-23]MCF2947841.1 response regulator [Paraglaciecola sp. G1-23]
MKAKKVARILIVEDDEDDYVIARDCLDVLDNYSFIIDWVSTPDDAITHLKSNVHDICLLDYQLGAYTGLTVLETASDMQCRTPIIMLTGQSDSVLDKAALDAGAVDFVVKSEFDSPRFSRAILYALARHEAEKERLERINIETKIRAKDRFLAHLSHELRTPLTSILGYTELLLENKEVAVGHSELNIILNNSQHLLSLLNDVLDLSKIAANKLELNPTNIYIDSFLTDILTLMQVSAIDKGIDLVISATTKLPERIHSDPTRLRQILINLIHNGIKFTETGGVEVYVSAHQEKTGKVSLEFKVVDTGTGIAQSELDNIFQPFEQVADIISRREIGAGLGLAISSELANKLGGSISVSSVIDEGSCFTLTLNLEVAESVEYFVPSFEQTKYTPNNKEIVSLTGKVLVVDDLLDIRKLVGHLVGSFGLEVDFASNGQEAIDKINLNAQGQAQYDAVIMDIHMPVLDGKKAIVKIRELGFEKPVVALTAATMKGVSDLLKSLGFNYVISKPVDKVLLNKLLAKALAANNPDSAKSISPKSTLATPKDGQRLPEQNILLVEDDYDAAEITKLLLESLNCKVKVAHTAQACLDILPTCAKWHKVLLDLHLPDGHGFELATEINNSFAIDEIVIVSGEEVSLANLQQYGCAKAVLKPLNRDKLTALFAQNLV